MEDYLQVVYLRIQNTIQGNILLEFLKKDFIIYKFFNKNTRKIECFNEFFNFKNYEILLNEIKYKPSIIYLNLVYNILIVYKIDTLLGILQYNDKLKLNKQRIFDKELKHIKLILKII
jgi:hypothetical protein